MRGDRDDAAGAPPRASAHSLWGQIRAWLRHTPSAPAPAKREPASADAATGTAEVADLSALQPATAPNGLRILVMVANRTVRTLIGKILEKAGHDVTATDRHDTAAAGEASRFDVVVLDSDLPGLGAGEASAIAQWLEQAQVPIVALARQASNEDRWHKLGVRAWIAKPLDPRELIDAVAAIADRSEMARPEPLDAETDNSGPPPTDGHNTIDRNTLESLERLGGADFVDELTGQFIDDAVGVLADLSASVKARDVHAFREQAHALRSAAANIGAQRIYEMCLSWREIEATALESEGEAHLSELRQEFERARSALEEIRVTRDRDGEAIEPLSRTG